MGGLGTTVAYGIAFTTEVGADRVVTPFVSTVAGDLSEGTFYDVSDSASFEARLSAPGLPLEIGRIR